MKNKKKAIELEFAFRAFGEGVNVSADDFEIDFKSALETGLGYLFANGIITNEDVGSFVEEYQDIDSENIDELMSRLKELRKTKSGE